MADRLSTEVANANIKRLLREDGDNLLQDVNDKDPIPPVNAVERIKDGFIHFKTNEFDKYPEYFAELAERQRPKFLVFACSDSRVCPSRILNFRPGEAFMTRNIANLVPAFNQVRYSGVGAVIEYSVDVLEVENILVIGHSRCGGIQELMNLPTDGATSNDFIHDWIKIGLPAKAKVESKWGDQDMEVQYKMCEREAVNLSLLNLLTYPYVQERVAKGNLKLMGGHYDFVEGKFELWGIDLDVKPFLSI